ncbi:MFS transporter [Nocardioides pyridinolyticus]
MSYRRILARPGALRFSLTGLVARLPISMVGLGIVLLVSAATGRYAVAGAVAAAYLIANAALAIPQGRWLDRFGQGRVLSALSLAFGTFVSLLVVAVQADWPIAAAYVFAALAGAVLPQVGSSVRARWSHVLDQPADVQTAYALEAVLDEVLFMLGPILITVLATAWHPVAGIAVALVACVGGTLYLAGQRATEPPAQSQATTSGPRPPMPWRTVIPLAVVCAALGVLFGAVEVTTVAFADEQGHRALSGVLLALWALGSLAAGVITGAVHWRRGPSYRVRWGALAMACAMAPLSFVGSLPLMGLTLLVAGFAIAPTMIAAMSLTEAVVSSGRLTEGMAIMQTGLVAGVAPGATLSGLVVDHQGASSAYLVSLAAGTVAALAALAIPRQRPATTLTA